MGIVAKYKFNQTIYENFIPTFNSEFTDYTITDEIDTDGYTIRTIESDSLPTQIKFGATTKTDREESLLEVYKCNTEKVNTMQSMFQNCSSLTSLDISNFNTENVKNMQQMFYNCSLLDSLDTSNFNTKNVTNMNYMFSNCSSLTSLDVSNFDTSNVTNTSGMFTNIKNLTDIGMIYCNSDTVNKISDLITTDTTIWYSDAKLENLTEKENITYKEYKMNILESDEEINLRSSGSVYDELNLLTGELIQRVDENGEILSQEIAKTINLKSKPSIDWKGDVYLRLENNTLYPQLECKVESINYYEIPKLKANTLYTLRYVGEPTQCIFGGVTYKAENNMILTSGSSNNLLYFDKEVRKVVLIEGDVRDRNFDYFEGIESLGAVEIITYKSNMPIFAKGGRK